MRPSGVLRQGLRVPEQPVRGKEQHRSDGDAVDAARQRDRAAYERERDRRDDEGPGKWPREMTRSGEANRRDERDGDVQGESSGLHHVGRYTEERPFVGRAAWSRSWAARRGCRATPVPDGPSWRPRIHYDRAPRSLHNWRSSLPRIVRPSPPIPFPSV
jgi:hypothetical protein